MQELPLLVSTVRVSRHFTRTTARCGDQEGSGRITSCKILAGRICSVFLATPIGYLVRSLRGDNEAHDEQVLQVLVLHSGMYEMDIKSHDVNLFSRICCDALIKDCLIASAIIDNACGSAGLKCQE